MVSLLEVFQGANLLLAAVGFTFAGGVLGWVLGYGKATRDHQRTQAKEHAALMDLLSRTSVLRVLVEDVDPKDVRLSLTPLRLRTTTKDKN